MTPATTNRVVLDREEPVPEDLLVLFEGLVRRRADGEPLAYVIGTAAFRTLELRVTRDTLIPRPETEGLVEHVLRWLAEGRGPSAEPPAVTEGRAPSAELPAVAERRVPRAEGRAATALDVGTGSGCIALALAMEGRFSRIVATDVSEPALAVAARNRDAIAPSVPVEFRLGSLFTPLGPDERFDVLVANPPYITDDEFAALDRSVRDWEPRIALAAGADGLDQVSSLIDGASAHLNPGGLLALEVDSRRADAVRAAARVRGWADVRIELDLFGRARYLLATTARAEP